MHLGNALSSLLAWLSARSQGGSMVMRIEDLDPRNRSDERSQQLMDDLRWLGLDWDEGPLYQSRRADAYDRALKRLQDQGLLYECFCSRAELHSTTAPHRSDGTYVYQGTCRNLTPGERAAKRARRPGALRVEVPSPSEEDGVITIDDRALGTFSQDLSADVGDFIVRRSDGVASYQLAVVVDDGAMGVTEVVRGNDLLESSPRQRYLQHRLGLPEVTYGHGPLLVSSEGVRLSKRDKALDLGYLRERVSPEVVVGFLGATAGLLDGPEPITARELLGEFSWEKVGAQPREVLVDPSEILG